MTFNDLCKGFDFPDYAQEFLRRNDKYRTEYGQLEVAGSSPEIAIRSAEMARSWGLEFPFPA